MFFFDLSTPQRVNSRKFQTAQALRKGRLCSIWKPAHKKTCNTARWTLHCCFVLPASKKKIREIGVLCRALGNLELLCKTLCHKIQTWNVTVCRLVSSDWVGFFGFPLHVVQSWVRRSIPTQKSSDWHADEAQQRNRMFSFSLGLFIVSLIGLNEEEKNWPVWKSGLIRHFLSDPYLTKQPQKLRASPVFA